MASLTITVADDKIARWRTAYGVATNAELKTAIIARVRQPVIGYEVNLAQVAADAAIKATKDTQTAAVTATQQAAELDIVAS